MEMIDPPIGSDPPGRKPDWFDVATRVNRQREDERKTAPMSAAWGLKWTDEDLITRLCELREAVHNLIRAHGVPPQCRLEFADCGKHGSAAAGFEDAPDSFERPFILLDKTPFEICELRDVRDVYCGLGLHEAGHILHTREGYLRHRRLSPRRQIWDNLWEDERIEDLVCKESPGFGPYIQAAKRALLERGEVGLALGNWDALSDMDKVDLLLFCFIRLPHLIDDTIKGWTAVNGECVFETLRAQFPDGPRDEADVETFTIRMDELWERWQALYPSSPAADGSRAGERLQRQLAADAEDRAVDALTGSEDPLNAAEASAMATRLLEEAATLEKAGCREVAAALLGQAIRIEASGDVWRDRAGRRFGLGELARVMGRMGVIKKPLDTAETEAIRISVRASGLDGGDWTWGPERRTRIDYPVPRGQDHVKYAAALAQVRGHVAAMRAALAVRLGERVRHVRELTEGRLDCRRLAHGLASDRVFRRVEKTAARGLAIGLLLDESGSMRCGTPPREQVALQTAVLIVEALKGVHGTELEVYSHTSFGAGGEHCLVRYLSGRKSRTPAALGGYKSRSNNYDHQAILTAARLFEENTTGRDRVLIVLSDGAPSGLRYEGTAAIKATRDSVEAVRKRGVRVVGVAIENYAAEPIYGVKDLVKFTDMSRLVADMRRLVEGIVRRVSRGP